MGTCTERTRTASRREAEVWGIGNCQLFFIKLLCLEFAHTQLPQFLPIEGLTILNFVSAALASPRTLTEKQATLLASRRERHFEF